MTTAASDHLVAAAAPRRTVVRVLAAFGWLASMGAAYAAFGPTPALVVAAVFVSALVVLATIDVEQRRIPNAIVLPAAAVVLALQIGLFSERATEVVVAALGASGLLLLLNLVSPSGLGMGDVKLALLLGAGLGADVVPAIIVGSLGAAAFGFVLMARRGLAARRQPLPFGPFLAAGAVLILVL